MSRFTKTDKLFRQLILKERPAKCEWCGKPSNPLQVAHILPKGAFPRLRYQRANVLLLCFYCHMIRAHRNPLEFREWLVEYKGGDPLNQLRTMERILPKTDLKMINIILQKELEQLKGANNA